MSGEKKKGDALGMPIGTATHRLRKMILFHLLKKHNENFCFQCGAKIEIVEELSIEHKKPWLHESVDLFWDMDNIAFSHLHCNMAAGRHLVGKNKNGDFKHGTVSSFKRHKCRCDLCIQAHRAAKQKYKK